MAANYRRALVSAATVCEMLTSHLPHLPCWLRVAVATAAGTLLIGTTPAVASATVPAESHCFVRVVGQERSGKFTTTAPECHTTFAEAATAAGVGLTKPASTEEVQAYNAAAVATSVIGTHYSGANLTGSSFSVVGSDCAGGWLNTSAAWSNIISSTANGCYRIRHFDGPNLTGSVESTISVGGNLTILDNRTESIQYTV